MTPIYRQDLGSDTLGEVVKRADARRDTVQLINDRQSTHGDFRDNGRVMQSMKEIARTGPSWAKMSPYQREGVEMILHKVGRIVCGDPNHPDHWVDIAGYAERVRSFLD